MSLLAPADPSRPAIVEGETGVVLSYGELRAAVGDWSAAFGPSKRLVLLVCRNDAFTIAAYLGALEAGHAVMLLDGQAADDVIADTAVAYAAHVVVGPAGVADRLAARGVPIRDVARIDDGDMAATGFDSAPALYRDLGVLLGTSGTTGSKKFVRLSRANIEANARSIAAYLGLDEDERAITSMPLHYSFGLSVLNSHLVAGAAVVTSQRSVLEPAFWTTVREQQCTSLAGVPYTFQMLERLGFRTWTVPSLRTLQQAGGALDLRLAALYGEHMRERGGRLFVMYGQTEASPRIAYVPPERLPAKLGSAGIAIPGGRLSIDGAASGAADGAGEVVYEGPNVMLGYATRADDLARGDDLHGVLRTGDLGYLDEDGYLYLVGRSKRIAKVFGLRLNLDEVEARLRVNGPAAVVAGDDAIWGFCAFGTDASVRELARGMAADFHIHHSGVRLRRVEAIPTAASGKVDYAAVQGWVERAD